MNIFFSLEYVMNLKIIWIHTYALKSNLLRIFHLYFTLEIIAFFEKGFFVGYRLANELV